MREEFAPRCVARRGGRQCRACRRPVQRRRALFDARRRAHAGGDRCLAGNRAAKRVDREDRQLRRMREQRPIDRAIASEHRRRQFPGLRLVRIGNRFRLLRVAQGGDDALAHLACGLARERHRHHSFRALDGGQQRKVALDQQLGLARSGRCLHQERLPRIQRQCTMRCIARKPLVVTHRHRTLRPPRPRRRGQRRLCGKATAGRNGGTARRCRAG